MRRLDADTFLICRSHGILHQGMSENVWHQPLEEPQILWVPSCLTLGDTLTILGHLKESTVKSGRKNPLQISISKIQTILWYLCYYTQSQPLFLIITFHIPINSKGMTVQRATIQLWKHDAETIRAKRHNDKIHRT